MIESLKCETPGVCTVGEVVPVCVRAQVPVFRFFISRRVTTHSSSSIDHTTSKWRDLEWDSPSDLRWLVYLCVIMRKLGSEIAPLPSPLLSISDTLPIPLLSLA